MGMTRCRYSSILAPNVKNDLLHPRAHVFLMEAHRRHMHLDPWALSLASMCSIGIVVDSSRLGNTFLGTLINRDYLSVIYHGLKSPEHG